MLTSGGNGSSAAIFSTTGTAPATPAITAGSATTFCAPGSVILSTTAATPVTDLSYTYMYTGFGSTQFWQAFTPTQAGLTTGINVVIDDAPGTTYNFTLNIYSGSGISGSLLYTQAHLSQRQSYLFNYKHSCGCQP